MCLAERAGFEPALGDYPKHAFQACDLNRSSTSPFARFYANRPLELRGSALHLDLCQQTFAVAINRRDSLHATVK